MTRYRVTAPYVTATVPSAALLVGPYRGSGVLGFTEGAILPDDTAPESIELLLRKSLIEEVSE